MKENTISILILTQKNYSEELRLVIERLNELEINKYFKCYLASKDIQKEKEIFPDWNNIKIDSNCITWGSELICCLNSIKEEYIFILLDDLYPYNYISASKFKEKIKECIKYKPSLIRVNSNYNRRIFLRKIINNIFIETYQNKYSTSLVFPIFQKKFLRKIVSSKDTPWTFEKKSNSRFQFNKHLF